MQWSAFGNTDERGDIGSQRIDSSAVEIDLSSPLRR